MGKPTGFLEFQRLQRKASAVAERLKNYKEFVIHLNDEEAKAGRALHGLRHPVLQQRLSREQHHSGLERPGLPPGLEAGASSLHSTNNFPSSPAASARRPAKRRAR